MSEPLPPGTEPAKNSNRLIFIVAAMAAAMVIAATITYFLTQPKSPTASKTPVLTQCPAANKQHPEHCISSNIDELNLQPGVAQKYTFAVLDENNQPIKEYETVHEKQMHVIVVRKDLAYFQHIHPTLNKDTGTWTLSDLTLPADGQYRLFADFTEAGTKTPMTIYEDITAGDLAKYQKQPIGDTIEDKTFDRYHVILQTEPIILQSNTEAKLTYLFSDAKNGGQSINNLEPYLGAMGHAVILSESLDYIHAHAITDATLNSRGIVNFIATFPKEGNYRVFGQFQHQGSVFTTDFVVPVYINLAPADVRINSGDDVHSH